MLEALAESEGAQVPQSAPPASKAVVRHLPRELLTRERLQQLGDAQCSVCT